MCGIAGFKSIGRTQTEKPENIINRMIHALAHRGPDASGVWVDREIDFAIGHCRLSVIDLSEAGSQPMQSASERYVIVYNGEIYNYLEIRKELEIGDNSEGWRGHSDTEVMLAAIERWGVNTAVKKFVGMFAFALWDRKCRILYLCRDRIGEKPLYYGWINNTFVFGSELKALRAHPAWQNTINRNALALYLRFAYIPAPFSIYKNINKVIPGTLISFDFKSDSNPCARSETYWSAKKLLNNCHHGEFEQSESEVAAELEEILRKSIASQMIADVPLGAFLSGGVDSSTIVALMQTQSSRPVKTFSIGFRESGYNEAQHAYRVARHLGTEHTELYVSSADALSVIPQLPDYYDEPFCDASQIPTYLVARMAREHVTVSLSGDGGDELFGGYNRYFWGRNIWRYTGWLPPSMRLMLAKCLMYVKPDHWDALFTTLRNLLPALYRISMPGDKLQKLSEILPVRDENEMYMALVSFWKLPQTLLKEGIASQDHFLGHQAQCLSAHDFTDRMMYLDLMTYLPDDILVKVDRAAMAVSLETRIPFLDHRVIEFAWRIPLSMKIRRNKGKRILRRLLYKYVPQELIDRPKAGFAFPIDRWLRGPLRDWAESLIDERRIREEGFLNHAPIRAAWNEHLSGTRNRQYHLWAIFIFQAWLERWQ